MRVAFLLTLPLILGCTTAFCQIDAEMARDHVVIKYSPLPMFDTDNTIQFGVEVPLGKSRFSIQEDLGYGHSNFNLWYLEEDNPPVKQTYKSRTQLRYYFYEKRRVRAYVAGEYLYKRVVYRENQWVGMDCSGFGGCGYLENRDFKIARLANAGHVRVGWHFYFTNRLTMDVFSGIGFRDIKVRSLTPGIENVRISAPNEFWNLSFPGNHERVPSLVWGFHLGFVLGKFVE